jgi:hypothetical protein
MCCSTQAEGRRLLGPPGPGRDHEEPPWTLRSAAKGARQNPRTTRGDHEATVVSEAVGYHHPFVARPATAMTVALVGARGCSCANISERLKS